MEPLDDFENDPNITDKKFPGNPTRSYCTKAELKIVGELAFWERHSVEAIETMLATIHQMQVKGEAKIED